MSGENGANPETQPAPGTIERIRPRQLSQRDPAGVAKAIADSGYWKHISSPAQAMVIMAAGEELGLTPLAAVQGITIIEGKIGYRANLIATLIAQHEHYSYKVIDRKDDSCTLQFEIDGKAIADGEEGKVTFTLKDAEEAELVKPRSNWAKYPRRMCFWRALTEGAGIYFADLTAGTPVYTDEEIREVIHVEAEVDHATDAEVVADQPRLDDDRLERLVQGYEIAGPLLGGLTPLDGLNILLGSLGYDGLDSEPSMDFREIMSRWSADQADAVLLGFERAVDEADAEEVVDGEIVDEAATGEEAANASS
jgi:hypothetical protein